MAAGLVAAQCTGGLLQISEPEKREFRRLLLGGDDYHIYDYSLFYLNLRRNAVQRVTSHLAKAR